MLVLAVVSINLAFVFYTLGVWIQRRQRVLAWRHAALFGLGLMFDVTGTILMYGIAARQGAPGAGGGAVLTQIMAATGTVALALMAVHVVWAVVTLMRARPHELGRFHRWSVLVWAVWLVPYLTGLAGSMIR